MPPKKHISLTTLMTVVMALAPNAIHASKPTLTKQHTTTNTHARQSHYPRVRQTATHGRRPPRAMTSWVKEESDQKLLLNSAKALILVGALPTAAMAVSATMHKSLALGVVSGISVAFLGVSWLFTDRLAKNLTKEFDWLRQRRR